MTTYMANKATANPKWYLVDAKDKTLGRLASNLASYLRGKHKPEYTPHADVGDFVVVINVDKIRVTGNKLDDKRYYHYSGYPGGMKTQSFKEMQTTRPQRVLELAVKGMLPKGPLGRQMFRKLKIYVGDQHSHLAQQPEKIDL